LSPLSPWTIAFGIELPESLRTQPCLDAVNLWLQHKKEKGDAYKPTGLKTTFKKWEKEFTPDQLPSAIENAITQGWRGVYKPNQGGFGNGGAAAQQPQQPWQLRKAKESELKTLLEAKEAHPANFSSKSFKDPALCTAEHRADLPVLNLKIKSIEREIAQTYQQP
jgi:hypothetical protein